MDLTLREVLDRYGPSLALVAAIVILVAVFPSAQGGRVATQLASGDAGFSEFTEFTDVADGEEVFVAAVMEHGGHGGSAAGPVVQKVLDFYFNRTPPEGPEDDRQTARASH